MARSAICDKNPSSIPLGMKTNGADSNISLGIPLKTSRNPEGEYDENDFTRIEATQCG
jgi:hypothetical protein